MKNIKRIFTQVVFVLLLVVVFQACSSEQTAWENTIEQNTVSAFELFITDHPNSKYIEQANEIIEDLYWKETVSGNVSNSYELYLSKYPDGKFAEIAVVKKEEALWAEIQRGVSYDKLKEFIANYPESAYIEGVKERLEPCLWDETLKADNYTQYKHYIEEFPNGPGVIEATDRMDDSYWKSMSRKNSNPAIYAFNLLKYTHEFPNGKHKKEAYELMNASTKESNKVKIYTRNGCGRCEYAVNFLKQNHIDYAEYNTSDQKNSKLMWNEIKRSKKHYGNSITMPVIIYKNDCYFNIPDLKSQMEIIKYYSNMKKEDKDLLNSFKKKARGY